jgi:phage repressor protein C with HTH and peptisase S24 domain
MKTFYSKQDILNRLKEAYNINRDTELATLLGVSKSTLSNWVSRDSMDYDKVFSKCEHINIDWLLTGRGSKFREDSLPLTGDKDTVKKDNLSEIQIIHHPKVADRIITQQSIPVYNVEAAANLKTIFSNKDQNILGEITMPDIPRCDGAIYVRGDSMYPLLKSGDIVGYKEILDFDNVIFGEMYIVSYDIEGDEYVCVKYVNHSDRNGYIKLVSYNPHHDPKDIPISRISAMALVKFSIRMNTII